MIVLYSVQIFDIELSPNLYALKSTESKKVVLENWFARRGVTVGENSALCISKTNKYKNKKLYTHYNCIDNSSRFWGK